MLQALCKGVLKFLFAIAVLATASSGYSAQDDPRSRSSFYLDTYGQLDPNEIPLASRASQVFARLLRVADKAEYKDPNLLLIDSDSWPWAIALPDNSVVLTKGALELCYQSVSLEQGDVRLAMILGHELGHLAEDDYWHRDVYLSLSKRSENSADEVLKFIGERSGLMNADSNEWKTIVRDRELKADDRGFIYSALAGFDTSLLIEKEDRSFFHYWTEQTSSGQGNFHLTPEDRAAYLAARSGALTEVSELFRLGVAMVHLGEYEYGERIFRQVLTTFPAHEVYNNLGYIRLQQSLDYVSVDLDHLFWWPATLDTTPETPDLQTRSLQTLTAEEKADAGLSQAAQYFELAVKQNPAYLPGYLNLATTYFYLGKYNNAAAALGDAKNIAPQDTEVQGLLQIAMLNSLQGSVDYLPIAISRLEALIEPRQPASSLLFNLAQLYELSDQSEKALPIWKRFVSVADQIAEPYRSALAARNRIELTPVSDPGSQIRAFIDRVAHRQEDMEGMKDQVFDISFDEENLIRTKSSPWSLAYHAGDSRLGEFFVLSDHVASSAIIDCCGAPSNRQPTSIGEVWSYGSEWALLIEHGEIKEIWNKPAASN